MKNILIWLVLLSSFQVFAQKNILARPGKPIPSTTPIEAWVKLACLGTLTPVNSPLGIRVGPVATYYLQADMNEPFPNIIDLRREHTDFFHKLTDHCTTTRLAKVNLAGFTGVWLDWGSDYGYSKLEIGETFIYSNMCRASGQPCSTSRDCCSAGKLQQVTCSKVTNSCERSKKMIGTMLPEMNEQ